jgi:hypothetical protein
MSRDERMKK